LFVFLFFLCFSGHPLLVHVGLSMNTPIGVGELTGAFGRSVRGKTGVDGVATAAMDGPVFVRREGGAPATSSCVSVASAMLAALAVLMASSLGSAPKAL
jgi:hypothetical protein